MSEPLETGQARIGAEPSQYVDALHLLITCSRGLLQLATLVDLEAMRAHLAIMETIAPITEPTAYLQGGGLNLRDQQTFLDATSTYIDAIRALDRR